jgi:bifunctional non-homologous end joining protein LigD
VFDLLWTEGIDVTAKPVLERRRRLTQVISEVPGIQLGGYVEGLGKELFRESQRRKGWRGLWHERKDSIYQPGKRTSDWLEDQSTAPARRDLRKVKAAGKISAPCYYGTTAAASSIISATQEVALPQKGIRDALKGMKPLFTDQSPFENPPRIPERVQWIKPKLVCEISFAEWTRGGELRQTVSLGWRNDKKAKEVVLER